MAVAYNRTDVAYTGPIAHTFTVSAPSNVVTVEFTSLVPPLNFKSIPNQTTTEWQGFEVLLEGSTLWQNAKASITAGGSAVAVQLPSANVHAGIGAGVGVGVGVGAPAGQALQAVRYAWAPVPQSQLLFDSASGGDGLFGLPAGPFWANCSAGTAAAAACTLLPPGEVPGQPPAPPLGPFAPYPPPTPPGPSPSPSPTPSPPPVPNQCPRKNDVFPAPGVAPCSFTNNTAFMATPDQRAQVALNDYAKCCQICKAEQGCTAASMSHGPKDAGYDFCFTFSAANLKPKARSSACPSLNVVMRLL